MSADQLLDTLSSRDVLTALKTDVATVAKVAAAMIETREISAADWIDLRIACGRVGVLRDLIR